MKGTASVGCAGEMELDGLILKCNLWKFLKVLRAQNRPLYKLVCGASESAIRIEIWLKERGEVVEQLSVARFVEQLTELPSKTVAYRLYIRTYHFSDSSAEPAAPRGEGLYVATHRDHLSAALLRPFVAYLCYEARRNGTPFLPTREQILHYGFARKDVVALEPQLAACNEALARELATDDEHK